MFCEILMLTLEDIWDFHFLIYYIVILTLICKEKSLSIEITFTALASYKPLNYIGVYSLAAA